MKKKQSLFPVASPSLNQPPIRKKKRSFLLLLPFFLFLCLPGLHIYWLQEETQLQQETESQGAPFGSALYQAFTVLHLESDPFFAEDDVYRLVQVDEPSHPYLVLKYPQKEREAMEEKLRNLPLTLSGVVDVCVGEPYEYLNRFLYQPALQAGYPPSLVQYPYYVWEVRSRKTFPSLSLCLLTPALLFPYFLFRKQRG